MELRRIGRLISAERSTPPRTSQLASFAPWVTSYDLAFQAHSSSNSTPLTYIDFLCLSRRSLHRLLYREERLERQRRLAQSHRARINGVLMGGSSKRLQARLTYSAPPLALADPATPDVLHTSPENVKKLTQEYFSQLYHHDLAPSAEKPWMDTPSVMAVKERVRAQPFVWRQPVTISSFRSLLRKGNSRPAPGPDEWEKWQVRALNDDVLQLILDLANYEILASHVPTVVKPSTLSTIHKRGSRIHLSNYRGITCSTSFSIFPSPGSTFSSRLFLLTFVSYRRGKSLLRPAFRVVTCYRSCHRSRRGRTRKRSALCPPP